MSTIKIVPCVHCAHLVDKGYQKKHCGMFEFTGIWSEGKFSPADALQMVTVLTEFAVAHAKGEIDPDAPEDLPGRERKI